MRIKGLHCPDLGTIEAGEGDFFQRRVFAQTRVHARGGQRQGAGDKQAKEFEKRHGLLGMVSGSFCPTRCGHPVQVRASAPAKVFAEIFAR